MAEAATTYRNDRAYSNSWIVYINGLQIPTTAASVAHGVWQIPEAQISLVPDPRLARLGAEDRVMVQVFYCDQWYRSSPEFCLAFDGEVVAWGYAMSGNNRVLTFTCIDYMQILTQLFFFFMSSFDDMAAGVGGQEIGVGAATVTTAGYGALYPYTLFSQGLADPGNTLENNAVIERPIDFAYNIVRALIKAQHPNRTIPAANFFSPWCKRTNFHRRWVALPYLDADPAGDNRVGVFPILRAVRAEKAIAAVARMSSSVGTSGSMWDMLRDVLMTMMMEVAMIPSPATVQSDYTTLLPKGAPTRNGVTFLASYFVKPQFFFGLPPSCNVFFPSQISDYAYNENYITQPTRMYFNEEAILSALNANGSVSGGLGSLMQDALTTAYPEEVDLAARAAIALRGLNGKNLLVYPEEFFKGPVVDRRAMPRWFLYLLEAERDGVVGETGGQVQQSTEQGIDASSNNIPAVTVSALPDGELNGALHAVYDTSNKRRWDSARAQQLFGVRLPADQTYPSAEVRDRLAANRTRGPVGRAMPPQVFPIVPASAGPLAASNSPGDFFAGRTGGRRVHAGLDIQCRTGNRVVSTTPGTVVTVRRNTSEADAGGNWIAVRDPLGGVHRYMHLDSIDASIAKGGTVGAGTTLGVSGASGYTRQNAFGAHLHYDVTSSGRYRLNYRNVLEALRSGRSYAAPVSAQRPAATPPAPVVAPSGAAAGATAPVTANTNAADLGSTRVTNAATAEISAGDTNRNIFRTYAAYEYFKERYSRRQGSVSMAFNPYVVAGFPCATFDRRSSAIDTIGYVMSVRQSMSSAGWSTDVAFSHGRTLQEMFSLMQRTYATEAARLGVQRAEISAAVYAGDTNVLAGFASPIGAIATAPAEPINAIGAVIQDFEGADLFYQALFHQRTTATQSALSSAQLLQNNESADDLYVPYVRADEIAAAVARQESTGQILTQARQAAIDAVTTQSQNATSAAQRPPRRGVFYYPDIIDIIDIDGNRSGIQIQGATALTSANMLRVIGSIRTATVTDTDWAFFQEVTSSPMARPVAGEDIRAEDLEYLQGIELEYRTRGAESNLRGDVSIVPRQGAQSLFESYSAAMSYNGRPVCTLEEYINFLGADGLREGAVNPASTSSTRGTQLHPAKFYTRIRRLRAGPPGIRPLSNTTGTTVSTDSATGAEIVTPETVQAIQATSLAQFIQTLAPELEMAVADILQDLQVSGAVQLFNGNTIDELRAQLATARTSGQVDAARIARLERVIEQAQRRLGGQATNPMTGGAALANTPTNSGAGASANSENQVYPVDGIPVDFPDTRANWDTVLEAYRRDVLTRLAPKD